ncbi:MAG: EamA family transporter [Dissulfurimicrobium sp.]|uniref:EamA family transporter n=1 Tax=Dissulfurimicrobium sp. TaxID=2022436 RepID=UPI00404AC045
MNWFPIALLTAFFTATTDAVIKSRFACLSPQEMAVVRASTPVPFLLPPLLFMPWPRLEPGFWQTITFLLSIEIFALFFYMKAIKTSPLSLSVPFLSFTPVFMILTAWLILGEKASQMGLIGILCTVAGAYLLHFRPGVSGILWTFRAAVRDKGSRIMIFVSAIYAVTSVLGKKAVSESSPFFFACFYCVLLGIATPVIFYLIPRFLGFGKYNRFVETRDTRIFMSWSALAAVGLSQSVMVISHMWAIHLVSAAYMIAVKRMSAIFSVLYGRFIFSEDELIKRLAGAGLMVFGVTLIMFTG